MKLNVAFGWMFAAAASVMICGCGEENSTEISLKNEAGSTGSVTERVLSKRLCFPGYRYLSLLSVVRLNATWGQARAFS